MNFSDHNREIKFRIPHIDYFHLHNEQNNNLEQTF